MGTPCGTQTAYLVPRGSASFARFAGLGCVRGTLPGKCGRMQRPDTACNVCGFRCYGTCRETVPPAVGGDTGGVLYLHSYVSLQVGAGLEAGDSRLYNGVRKGLSSRGLMGTYGR